jgi:pyruvate/2-oxoglutarate dehydrogenase complex dihydrolipoamide dehydrogenase (E3) component
MNYEYHAIIIGGGSAGLTVASGCAALGAKVALIEKGKMGGDCLNSGCVPSKAFLRSAHLLNEIRCADRLNINANYEAPAIALIMERVRSVIGAIAPHDSKERFEKLGVTVIEAEAVLLDNHRVKANGITLTGKYIVIAAGSKPALPPIPGLKDVPYFTNENIFNINVLPKHLLVLGAGPIGLELGQAFKYLGSAVSIIDQLPCLLPNDDAEAGRLLEQRFSEENINFHLGSKIIEVRPASGGIGVTVEKNGVLQELSGDTLLVALGRVPAVKDLGLENAGVRTDARGYIITDDRFRTSAENIYACGDCAAVGGHGPYQFTHTAGYQGSIVARNLIVPFKGSMDHSIVPWVTYTKPEVAHVGLTEHVAADRGLFGRSIVVDLDDADRSKTDGEEGGFLKIVVGGNGRVIGVTIVADKAGEMIGTGILAVKNKLKPAAFASLMFPYPTQSELYKTAAYLSLKDSFKPWMKKLVKKFLV